MKKLKCISLFVLISISLLVVSIILKGDLSGSGTAYFDVSPDEKYTVMLVYLDESDNGSYQMLMTPEKKVLFVRKTGRNGQVTNGAIWMNKENDNVDNDYVQIIYDSEIILPPSIFQKIYAWLFVSISGFNINNMVMKPL